MQIEQEIWLPQWLEDGLSKSAVVLAAIVLIFGPHDMVSVGMATAAGVYGVADLATRRIVNQGGHNG